MRKFVVLCENQLKKIMQPKNESVPVADPEPIVAGHVFGTYASAEIAERAILGFDCTGKHFIVEAIHWKRLEL